MCSYCSVVHLVLSSEDVGLSEGTLRLEPTELASHGTGPGIQRLVFFPRFLLDVRGSVDHMATAASCHARGRDMCQAQCCPFSLVTETCKIKKLNLDAVRSEEKVMSMKNGLSF